MQAVTFQEGFVSLQPAGKPVASDYMPFGFGSI